MPLEKSYSQDSLRIRMEDDNGSTRDAPQEMSINFKLRNKQRNNIETQEI